MKVDANKIFLLERWLDIPLNYSHENNEFHRSRTGLTKIQKRRRAAAKRARQARRIQRKRMT